MAVQWESTKEPNPLGSAESDVRLVCAIAQVPARAGGQRVEGDLSQQLMFDEP